MSLHSRSSSEVETIHYREILPVFLEDFIKDFSFFDVKLRVRDIFTNDEYEFITNDEYESIKNDKYEFVTNDEYKTKEKRIIRRLFWVLYQKTDDQIHDFLQAIIPDYDWLANRVIEERKMLHRKTEFYVEALRTLCSNNQKHTDYNIHRMEYYEPLRQALKCLKSRNYVVLTGTLGMGKKWLAIDVCTDYKVQRSMDFKIYWVDVSQCTSREKDLNALQQLNLKLGDSNFSLSPAASGSNLIYFDISNRMLQLQQYLSFKFRQEEYKNALVILVDVPSVKAWETFNLGCKLLIITRNKKVSESLSPKMATHIDIDNGLTLPEFYSLFERYLCCSREQFPNNATDLYNHSRGHPLLLSIIAQNLHQKNTLNWDEWISNVQNFRFDKRLTKVIELSLNVLQPEQLELYAVFAIFPNCIPQTPYLTCIPVKLLAALWDKKLHDAEEIILKFHKHSLVEKFFYDGTMGCCVPFVYSSHLKNSNVMQSKINSHELHRKVIEYYKIEESLKHRTEIDLCNSHHDLYFYKCIGYHINEANCKHLFPRLYLDFGFLGQMLRKVKLLHTIDDLKRYREEIVDGDQRRRNLLSDLLEFLPKIEDMLVRSEDTCLLQYALMTTGSVHEEALKQVQRFPNRVWLNETGLFHQRRQIVTLPNKPKLLKFLEEDICLINLENNDILLVDLSLDFNNGHIFLTNEDSKIIEVQLIRNNKFLVTLGANGELKLWCIRDDQRRNLVRRRSSKQKVNPLNFNNFLTNKQSARKCKQSLHVSIAGVRSNIVSFYIDQLPEKYNSETHLHVAYDNGDVSMFKWDEQLEEFEAMRIPTLHTGVRNIRFLCKFLFKYYMMLNNAGNISFWNLQDGSRTLVSFEWPKDTSNLICYELHIENNSPSIIFIFGLKILRLTFKHQRVAVLEGELETLYECTDQQSAITCGRLTRNGRYLVLGTKRGLIVFDTFAKSEILRSNVSEVITCVDIYSLDNENYKYIIVCGSQKTKILNIFSFRDEGRGSVIWAHNVAEISCEERERPQLEANVWLKGHKLYDVIYMQDTTLLFAVDSKYRIHQICATDTKNWSIVTPTENLQRITAITACERYSFIAYDNGAIFNVTNDAFEQEDKKFTENPINYLQLINDDILVASSKPLTQVTNLKNDTFKNNIPEGVTQVRNLKNDTKIQLKMDTVQCYLIFKRYLILINEFGFFVVLDVENQFKILHKLDAQIESEIGKYKLGGCDFKNGRLFIGTISFNIYVYIFNENGESLKVHKETFFEKNERTENEIKCLAASSDSTLIAIGLNCGDIEIYKMAENTISFLYNLQSHTEEVYDLKFSPFDDVLVSCAEQLCFWHVSHILNNPLKLGTKKRRSSRFSSQHSTDIEDAVDAVKIDSSNGHHLQVNNLLRSALQATTLNSLTLTNYWQNKRGPANKPELLACIKFVGHKAEKFYANKSFTQFDVIDNEGVYYHLTLLELDQNQRGTMEEEQNVLISTRRESLPIAAPTTPEINGYGTTRGQHPLDVDICDDDDNVLI